MPPDFELNTLRFALALLPVCVGLIFTKKLPRVTFSDAQTICAGALGYIGCIYLIYSHLVKYLPLGSVGAIENGAQIVWSSVLVLIYNR